MKPRTGGSSMFLRMMVRAALVRKGRATAALLAIVVAAGVATAMLNLYVDVQTKLQKEFRNYGANLVIVAKDGKTLPADALTIVDATVSGHGIAVPFSYAVASTPKGASVVIAGTDLRRAKALNSWWSISDTRFDLNGFNSNSALMGTRAAELLSPKGDYFLLKFNGKEFPIKPFATLTSGDEDDARIYLDMYHFTEITGLSVSTIEVSASGTVTEVEAMREKLAAALPSAEVKPVRQIVEAEGRVLGKARASLLASAVVIVVTAILCVLATLTAWVLEQRKNFAIMKALGASERIVTGFFAAEAAALGALGAALGFVIGLGVAAWIARSNFHASLTPRFSVLPIVITGSVLLALVSALLPIAMLRRVQPATILRGE